MGIDIKKEDNYISATLTGEIDYTVFLELWKEIIRACDEYKCFNILGVSDTKPMNNMDALNHEKIFKEAGVSIKHRIAWVEKNPSARAMIKFVEGVLMNRNLINGRLFADVSEAKAWLLKE